MSNGVLLDDRTNYGGVLFDNRQEWLVVALPKGTVSRQRHPKDSGKKTKADGTIYMIPKTDGFAYAKTKLADGSVLVVNRYKPIPFADRLAMYEKVHAEHPDLPLEKPEERKAKEADPILGMSLNLDDLK